MQGVLISIMRLSAALTLYSLEQFQNSVFLTQEGKNPLKVLNSLESALDSLTESLVDQIDSGKKTALESVTSMAQDLVSTSFDGVNVIDPRQILRATDDILRASSQTVADWMDRTSPAEGEAPRSAADVLDKE
jgi:hypothetical protein